MTPQEALLHGPGEFSAICVGRLVSASGERDLPGLGAELLETLERDDGVLALFGARPGRFGIPNPLEASPLLPHQGPGGRLPSTQGELLVQLAADSREALSFALRRCVSRLKGVVAFEEELLGGRLGVGREPFGFRDGLVPPEPRHIREVAVIPSGPLEGFSWALYLRFEQQLEQFARLQSWAQERVMGRSREGVDLPDAPDSAHVNRMRGAQLIRRGFPYRASGQEGLAFIAAARDPAVIGWALSAWTGRAGPVDALLRYCEAVAGGVYLLPPREWFSSEAVALAS